jgi:hypothetical protein
MFDIIHLLTGDPAYPPSLDSMVDRYVDKRRFDVEHAAWYAHYLDREAAARMIEAYESLPEPLRLHFLLSPASYEFTFEFNRHRTLQSLNDVVALIEDEAAFVGDRPTIDRHKDSDTIWSPMGDEMLQSTSDGWTRRSAVRLDGLILVDFDSPQARMIRATSPMMYRPPEDFSDAERAVVLLKLERALTYIDEVSPTFGRLVRNYTRAIRLRKCEQFDGFSSEHVTNTIGEIRIMNAHRDEYPSTRLAEALVHESVHNFLSTYEYLNQTFVFEGDDRRYRPVSPWTRNPIPVPSFGHAVFVWFALFHFAMRELERPGLSAERRMEIRGRRNHYASGFLIPTPLFDCVRGLATFNHALPPTMNTLQTIVQSFADGKATSLDQLPELAHAAPLTR